MATNPSNQKVEDVQMKRDLYESGVIAEREAKDLIASAYRDVLHYIVDEMGHADILTAKRMARAALGRTPGRDTLQVPID